MNSKIIIANFKAEQTKEEIIKWLNFYIAEYKKFNLVNKQIIFCPSTLYLSYFREQIESAKLPVFLGAQDLSRFGNGKYTGEVSAKMLKDYCDYVIIGHSERREYFQEEVMQIQKKILQANDFNLGVILCLENPEVYTGKIDILAYEPKSAIGTGVAEEPKISWQKCLAISHSFTSGNQIYGGSVNSENAPQFTAAGFTGVLVGTNSLNPEEFLKIAQNV